MSANHASTGDGRDHISVVAGRPRLGLLGGFEFRNRHRLVTIARPAQRLLAFLGVRSRPQLRTTVASTLWADVSEDRAAANLRSALWKIRRSGWSPVMVSGSHLCLSDAVDVDLTSLVARARRLVADDSPLDREDVDIPALADDLLPGWDEDWLVVEREALRQLRVHALESLCRRLSAQGRHAEAIDAGQAAVAADPLRETAQRALVEAHLAEGNASEAIRQLRLYRRALEDCLGIQPSTDLVRLVTMGSRLKFA